MGNAIIARAAARRIAPFALAVLLACGRVGVELSPASEPCTGPGCTAARCADDPEKKTPGICGCGVSERDWDRDGRPDCIGLCPGAPDLRRDGRPGCARADVDVDGDGTPDYLELCPRDTAKQAPGVCGCGVVESDADGDGTPDCVDECPEDADEAGRRPLRLRSARAG